ncbi:MAG: DUF5711 family protein [Eubacteriales bacterium]|nr:DUF5711 family protein [Eubacteriales bacterium]
MKKRFDFKESKLKKINLNKIKFHKPNWQLIKEKTLWLKYHLKYNKKSVATFGIVAALVITGAFIYSFRYNLMFMSNGDSTPKKIYTLDASKQNEMYAYNDNILIVNNDGAICINKKGEEVFEVSAKTSTPIVGIAGDYILIADRGGSEVYVIHDGDIVNNFSAENEIINCSINRRGRTVLVTNETSYRNVIAAYNSRGDEIYKWKISDFYVIDAVMSYDGSRIAATYITTKDEQLSGGVVMVHVRREEVLGKVSYKDRVFSYVAFNGDNTATAIGDTMMLGVNKKGEERWAVDYDGKKLQIFGFREGWGSVLAFENNSNNSTIIAYDNNGREKGKNRLDFTANNIDMRSGLSLVTGSDRTIAVDRKCRQRLQINFQQEFKKGWFKDNKTLIYLVNGSNIEVIKL